MRHLQLFTLDVQTQICSIKFSDATDAVIEENKLQGVYAYQDDIIVAGDSFQDIIHKLQVLLSVLQKYNLTLSPAKCQIHQAAIDYIGFHLENHIIQPISSHITEITAFPVPKNEKHLKIYRPPSILQQINYSKLMDPLTKLNSAKVLF